MEEEEEENLAVLGDEEVRVEEGRGNEGPHWRTFGVLVSFTA